MPIQDIRGLRDEGLLHSRLIRRIRLLAGISITMLAMASYEVVRYGLDMRIALAIAIVAFILGIVIFARMNKVVWDEKEEVIAAGRIDAVGFAVIVLYITFDVALRTFVSHEYAGVVTGYVLFGIGASLLGRSLGTLFAIERLAKRRDLLP